MRTPKEAPDDADRPGMRNHDVCRWLPELTRTIWRDRVTVAAVSERHSSPDQGLALG